MTSDNNELHKKTMALLLKLSASSKVEFVDNCDIIIDIRTVYIGKMMPESIKTLINAEWTRLYPNIELNKALEFHYSLNQTLNQISTDFDFVSVCNSISNTRSMATDLGNQFLEFCNSKIKSTFSTKYPNLDLNKTIEISKIFTSTDAHQMFIYALEILPLLSTEEKKIYCSFFPSLNYMESLIDGLTLLQSTYQKSSFCASINEKPVTELIAVRKFIPYGVQEGFDPNMEQMKKVLSSCSLDSLNKLNDFIISMIGPVDQLINKLSALELARLKKIESDKQKFNELASSICSLYDLNVDVTDKLNELAIFISDKPYIDIKSDKNFMKVVKDLIHFGNPLYSAFFGDRDSSKIYSESDITEKSDLQFEIYKSRLLMDITFLFEPHLSNLTVFEAAISEVMKDDTFHTKLSNYLRDSTTIINTSHEDSELFSSTIEIQIDEKLFSPNIVVSYLLLSNLSQYHTASKFAIDTALKTNPDIYYDLLELPAFKSFITDLTESGAKTLLSILPKGSESELAYLASNGSNDSIKLAALKRLGSIETSGVFDALVGSDPHLNALADSSQSMRALGRSTDGEPIDLKTVLNGAFKRRPSQPPRSPPKSDPKLMVA